MLRKTLVGLFALAATAAPTNDARFFVVCRGHITIQGMDIPSDKSEFLIDLSRRVITIPGIDGQEWSITDIQTNSIEFRTPFGSKGEPPIGERKGNIDRLTGQMTWRTYTNDGRLNDHADYVCVRSEPRF
jgi:hypothetical protein